jgi:hypothetical protein
MKSRAGLAAILFLVVMLSACNSQPQRALTQAIATEVPSVTTAPTRAIVTATASRTAMIEPTEAMAQTTPTGVVAGTMATPATTPPPLETWFSTSPDGNWIAQGIIGSKFRAKQGMYSHVQLNVANRDRSVELVVVDEYYELLLGYTLLRPFHWTQDGQYFYFLIQPGSDGCFNATPKLQRVDLTSGLVTEIRVGDNLSLSPDESILAYTTGAGYGDSLQLALYDLVTGEEEVTELKAHSAEGIVWSPGGTTLMLTLVLNPCEYPTTLVARLDVASLSQSTIVYDDKRLLKTVEWLENDRVLLQDKDGNFWWLNPATGELTPKEN